MLSGLKRKTAVSFLIASGVLVSAGGVAFAQSSALEIDANGDVGIGTATPTSPLHVYRTDGTALIKVEDADPTVMSRTLFQLDGTGNIKFVINSVNNNVAWGFTNTGGEFRISRQDSGRQEFVVRNNGNAVLAGVLTQNSAREDKQALQALNAGDVLDRVKALPLFEWEYKDAPEVRHVGPMADDFFNAFQLGDTPKGLTTMDTSGVALAAIQALAEQNERLRDENAALEQRLSRIEALMGTVAAN